MFTLEQIHQAHSKVKSGADFPQYVQDLKDLGVTYYDIFVTDGQTSYYGENGFRLKSGARYPMLAINEKSSAARLKQAIAIHQQGQTDYSTFCVQAAEAGVEKWTTHLLEMIVTYTDKLGNSLLIEPIPQIQK